MKVVLSDAAVADIKRLKAWLAEKNPGAATRAGAEILKAIRSLDRFPDRGYAAGSGVRQLRVLFGKRGYVIRYEVFADRVQVARIFHGLEDR